MKFVRSYFVDTEKTMRRGPFLNTKLCTHYIKCATINNVQDSMR